MNFYDTCSILNNYKAIFKNDNKFALSSITLTELENIKTSAYKDEDVKYRARSVLHWLKDNENTERCDIILYSTIWDELIESHHFPLTNDSRIIASAFYYFYDLPEKDNYFVTEDLACRELAKSLGINVQLGKEDFSIEHKGFKTIQASDDNLATFYEYALPNNKNVFDLAINEYVIFRDDFGDIVEKYKWTKDGYERLKYNKCVSVALGELKPKDCFQAMALDSFKSNQITLLKGSAGSGKSLLAVSYLFDKLEHGEIDKIIMFVNPVAAKGAAKLGFLPGSKDQKILDSQIGNFLVSKIGDRIAVEKMIEEGQLFLVPMSDARGFDTTGMNAGVYVTEAQNMSIEMMKLLLQRIGDDGVCIIEGDDKAQVDMSVYAGSNNGMRRMSEIFHGQDYYGEVELQNCYRSKIARRAELM